MTAFLSPLGGAGWQFFDNQGRVLQGGKLFTYLAGSTTPTPTWIDYLLAVANANPVILNSAGRPPNEIWLNTEVSGYKFVLTDANNNILGTWDNISASGGGGGGSITEWVVNGLDVTYTAGNDFTVQGDQRGLFHVNRRLQYISGTGTNYGYVASNSYDSGANLTTVTIAPDTVGPDANLSVVNYALLDSVNVSVPQQYLKTGDNIVVNSITANSGNITNFSSSNVTITGGTISGIAGFGVPDYVFKNLGVV